MYFGWDDALMSPRAGLDYYERVVVRMGGIDSTQSFFRLFMVPGMLHCQGGPGPNAFGQAPIAPGLSDDPVHDIRRALEVWVEQGVAPQKIIAAKYRSDDPARGVVATSLLCPYPRVPTAPSEGSSTIAEERSCADEASAAAHP
jgi:feruloyl esterase